MIIDRAIHNLFHKIRRYYLDRRVIWKLIGGFGLILIILLLIVDISQMSLALTNGELNAVIDEELEPVVYLNDIRSYITELEIGTKDAILQKDQVALTYIRNEFLPNTVRKTVDYSWQKLIKSVSSIEIKGKLKEISRSWEQYYRLYEELLADPGRYQTPEFRQKANQLRFFLIGGMDRIVETHFRGQAVLAKAEAVKTYRKQQAQIWSLVGAAILLMILISIITTWMIVKPLQLMAEASRKIAKGDLKVELPENRRDEFGEVAGCFNLMVAELTFLVEKIKYAAGRVNENSRILLDGVNTTSAITQQLMDTLTAVATGASTQQMKVSFIHKAIQAITNFSQSVSEITGQVAALADDTVSKALDGENVSGEVVEKIQQIREFMTKSSDTIRELQSLGGEIEKMALIMQDIADETNLLSLNASIEAARAGDFGRGFGIVAKSIGKLADGTKETAVQTQDLVSRIQQMFANLIQMIRTENRVINEGEQAAAALESVFEAIITAAQQVDSALKDVKYRINHLAGEHDEMLKAVEEITEIAILHKEGTTQISATAGEHFSCTQEIISAGEILVGWGENLRQAVDKFKIKTASHELEKEQVS